MAPRVVLVGAPGAGKTTIGALVAQALSVPFRDTDRDVEATAGKPVAEVFLDDGEDVFRDLEAAAVGRALVEHDGVLALGGERSCGPTPGRPCGRTRSCTCGWGSPTPRRGRG